MFIKNASLENTLQTKTYVNQTNIIYKKIDNEDVFILEFSIICIRSVCTIHIPLLSLSSSSSALLLVLLPLLLLLLLPPLLLLLPLPLDHAITWFIYFAGVLGPSIKYARSKLALFGRPPPPPIPGMLFV